MVQFHPSITVEMKVLLDGIALPLSDDPRFNAGSSAAGEHREQRRGQDDDEYLYDLFSAQHAN